MRVKEHQGQDVVKLKTSLSVVPIFLLALQSVCSEWVTAIHLIILWHTTCCVRKLPYKCHATIYKEVVAHTVLPDQLIREDGPKVCSNVLYCGYIWGQVQMVVQVEEDVLDAHCVL